MGDNTKILIIGGSGLLGCALTEFFAKKAETAFTYWKHEISIKNAAGYKVDLAKADSIRDVLEEVRAEIVINAASPPSVDDHERNKEIAYRINVEATEEIAQKTVALGAKLVYISTSNVFPNLNRVFKEDDIPAPINFYGACKLGGELATRYNSNHLIIRTDQIYGWNQSKEQKKSFVVNTLEKLERGERVEVCEDWYNRPTYVNDIVMAISKLIELEKRGVYHVVGGSYINRLEWAKKIAQIFGKDESLVVGIKSASLKLPATRANANLDNSKIEKETGIKMKTVDEGLSDMKAAIHSR